MAAAADSAGKRPLAIAWIVDRDPGGGDGGLCVSALPGANRPPRVRSVEDDLASLAARGVGLVVCLLNGAELAYLGLRKPRYDAAAAAAGVELEHFPIEDMKTPEPEAAARLVERVVAFMRGGGSVLVHCRAGRGRSGTIAACAVRSLGLAASGADAVRLVRARRPGAVETRRQQEFVEAYAPPP